jgi:hypothetical protein
MPSEMIYPNGSIVPVAPVNGKFWTLGEMQAKVGGYIEIARTRDGRYMIVNENGKEDRLEPNPVATELYLYGEVDIIVGNALIIDNKSEMNEPDVPEED